MIVLICGKLIKTHGFCRCFREKRSLDDVPLYSLVLLPVLGKFRSRARVTWSYRSTAAASAVGARRQVSVHTARWRHWVTWSKRDVMRRQGGWRRRRDAATSWNSHTNGRL